MLIEEKLGNIHTVATGNCGVDVVDIAWYETNRRILHKVTRRGTSITLRFFNDSPGFRDGDILWRDHETVIVVDILPCKCIVITPANLPATAWVCYEIGNRHLPLFYEGGDLLVPYETPLYNLLQASGHNVFVAERKLNNPLKTTVLPHVQIAESAAIYNRIIQPTTIS